MQALRDDEDWVRRCIEKALNVSVKQHDDGTKPGMHDLEIVYPDRPSAAVEITAVVDQDSVELWRLIRSGGRWQVPSIAGGWVVFVLPSARAKRLRNELPLLLDRLERHGVRAVRVDEHRQHDPFQTVASDLGVVRADQGGTAFPGSIYVHIEEPSERTGGVVADTGDALPAWLTEWLREPERANKLTKLQRSGASERHLAVILPEFTTAPFGVIELLMRDGAPLPTVAPVLPKDVTHVWLMSTWAVGHGFHWSPNGGWEQVEKLVGGATTVRSSPPH